MYCPRCKSSDTRTLTTAGKAPAEAARVECAKCGRFVRWDVAAPKYSPRPGNESVPPKPHKSDSAGQHELQRDPPSAPPDVWLYVTKRLDLELLPNVPMWSAAVVSIGGVIYYRLSAGVLAWLEAAGESLVAEVSAGRAPADQLNEYLDAMGTVYLLGSPCVSASDLAAARAQPPSLPSFACPDIRT